MRPAVSQSPFSTISEKPLTLVQVSASHHLGLRRLKQCGLSFKGSSFIDKLPGNPLAPPTEKLCHSTARLHLLFDAQRRSQAGSGTRTIQQRAHTGSKP